MDTVFALATAAGLKDGPSRFLLDRVHNSEPPEDWQGVWVFDSK